MEQKIVVFNGGTYIRSPKSRYYFKYATKNGDRKGARQLHRAVWEYYNGPIPDGYHIHHIDHDVDNNDISNLECIPAKEHLAMHARMNMENDEYREKNRQQLFEAQKKAVGWHSSEEGKAWHAKHAVESIGKTWVKEERVCEECGKTFMGTKNARFCSELCGQRSRARRAGRPVRERERVCEFCGRQYVATIGAQKYCSSECRLNAEKERKRNERGERQAANKCKKVLCAETGVVYESVKSAASQTGFSMSGISSVCNGHYKTTHGYHFKFVEQG